jgi:hypothetical protein
MQHDANGQQQLSTVQYTLHLLAGDSEYCWGIVAGRFSSSRAIIAKAWTS